VIEFVFSQHLTPQAIAGRRRPVAVLFESLTITEVPES